MQCRLRKLAFRSKGFSLRDVGYQAQELSHAHTGSASCMHASRPTVSALRLQEHIHMHAHTRTPAGHAPSSGPREHAYIHLHMQKYIHAHMHCVCMSACMHAYMHACVNLCLHVRSCPYVRHCSSCISIHISIHWGVKPASIK